MKLPKDNYKKDKIHVMEIPKERRRKKGIIRNI